MGIEAFRVQVNVTTRDNPFPPDHFAGIAARGIWTSSVHHSRCQGFFLREGAANQIQPYSISSARLGSRGLGFTLCLYAEAAARGEEAMDALKGLLGHGIGPERIPVQSVDFARKEYTTLHFPVVGRDASAKRVRIYTRTPFATSTPQCRLSVTEILRAAARRFTALGGDPPAPEEIDLLECLPSLQGRTFQRRSARTHHLSRWHGVEGEWICQVGATSFGLSRLASFLDYFPVGSRTSFGCGSLALELIGKPFRRAGP